MLLLSRRSVWRREKLIGALVAALYVAHAALFGWYVADDAGISLAYARNLVHGYGPVLYPGAPAVEGYSNPLWVAILAIGAALKLDGAYGIPLMKVVGVALGFAAIALVPSLGRRAYPTDAGVSWVGPVLLALSTPFVFWSSAGLENGLYAFALAAAAWLHLAELDNPQRRPWSALALLAVALTRPEGCAFFLAFLIHRVIAGGREVRRLHRLAFWTALFVAGFVGFLLLRFYAFGDWLPNTYHAKVADRHLGDIVSYAFDGDDDGRTYVVGFARAVWPVLVAALIGLSDFTRWRANLLFAFVIGGTVLYVLYVGGDFWPASRFFASVLPVIALAAQHGVARLVRWRPWLPVAVTAVVVVALLPSTVRASLDLRRRHHDDTLISLQGRIAQGQKIRAHADRLGIEDPLYLEADIGGPTLVGLRVLDLGGLTDLHIARFDYYSPFFRRYIFEEQRPHFIRTHASWTRSSRLTLFPEFHAQYAALKEYRDARGLHGEFVRRDLLAGAPPANAEGEPATPSFSQARRDARLARQREDARERDGWIEYYTWRRDSDRLRAAFRDAEAAGSLPREPRRQQDLYYALLAANLPEAAARVRDTFGLPTQPRVELHAGGPVLALLGSRVVQHLPDPTSTLVLYLQVLDTRARDFTLWLHLYPAEGGTRETRDRELRPVLGDVGPGGTAALEIPLYVPAGDYDLRIGGWRPGTKDALCTDAGERCYLLLGTHPVGR